MSERKLTAIFVAPIRHRVSTSCYFTTSIIGQLIVRPGQPPPNEPRRRSVVLCSGVSFLSPRRFKVQLRGSQSRLFWFFLDVPTIRHSPQSFDGLPIRLYGSHTGVETALEAGARNTPHSPRSTESEETDRSHGAQCLVLATQPSSAFRLCSSVPYLPRKIMTSTYR